MTNVYLRGVGLWMGWEMITEMLYNILNSGAISEEIHILIVNRL